jgi:hypothetical protein
MRTLLTQTFCVVCNTQNLSLKDNKIGDAGMIKFSEALAGGALPALTTLRLYSNQIGDAGVTALANACAGGAMAQLKVSWRPTGLSACLETWHTRSPDSDVWFGVPYAGAFVQR